MSFLIEGDGNCLQQRGKIFEWMEFGLIAKANAGVMSVKPAPMTTTSTSTSFVNDGKSGMLEELCQYDSVFMRELIPRRHRRNVGDRLLGSLGMVVAGFRPISRK